MFGQNTNKIKDTFVVSTYISLITQVNELDYAIFS